MTSYPGTILEIVTHLVIKHPELVGPITNICAASTDAPMTTLNMLATFPLYRPASGGTYAEKAKLTAQTIQQVFPFLCNLIKSTGKLQDIEDVEHVPQTDAERQSAEALKALFNRYGSDKSTFHNYHNLYGTILADRNAIASIFEVGLGTNNTDVVSNMGAEGKPGASLRAFRDHCPNAKIYGADIDKRVLFSEERISTFYVDQTVPATFGDLRSELPQGIDLVIDDGLHSPDANVATLEFGLGIVRKGGWVVVEDIANEALSFWQTVAALMPAGTEPHIYVCNNAIVFAVRKLD